ncbi:hypothetical protein KEM55_000029, partial [Ascosphaera atra]
ERQRAVEYTSKDLAGVKVGHELDEFDPEGGEQILTLKDTTIDENEEEGDELENVQLREQEKLKENLERKKRRVVYDPNTYDEGGNILAQYDDEIEGKKRKRFTLDAKDLTTEEREAKRQDVSSKLKTQSINLNDVIEPTIPSDYQEPVEIKVKKPKKKKAKSTRKKRIDDDEDALLPPQEDTNNGGDKMDIDTNAAAPPPPTRKYEDDDLLENDDLQLSLAAQRRAALKKRKKLTPEELAKQLREEAEQAEAQGFGVDGDGEDGGDGEPALILDETSEFAQDSIRHTGARDQGRG